MKQIVMYKYFNPETKQLQISYEPMRASSCTVRYHLIADEGKVLVNKETKKTTRATIIPKWELTNWEEVDI